MNMLQAMTILHLNKMRIVAANALRRLLHLVRILSGNALCISVLTSLLPRTRAFYRSPALWAG